MSRPSTHTLSLRHSGSLQSSKQSRTVWGYVSDPVTLEAVYMRTSFVCAILSDVTNRSTTEAIHSGLWVQPGGNLYGHSGLSVRPIQLASPVLLHPWRWPANPSNCSIYVASMLVDGLSSCFTRAGSPAINSYTKVCSGNPPNRTASFFSASKKTSTVLPAINVQVVKCLYTVQGSITKALYSAALVSLTSAFFVVS